MRALLAYFSMAFCIAWGGIVAVTWRTGLPDPGTTPIAVKLSVFLAMLAGPSLASLLLTALFDGRQGLRDLFTRIGRWRGPWAALLIAPGTLLAVLLGLGLVSPAFLPGPPNVAFALIAGLGAGIFEELGWTGFATPRLVRRIGVVRTGVVLGLIWALWHALADFWGSAAAFGPLWIPHILQWFVALTAFRLIMTWVYDRTQSVLFGMALHATFTGSQALFWPTLPPHLELVWYGLFGVLLWAVAATLVRSERVVTGARSC